MCPHSGNAEALQLAGGTVTPSYHSKGSVITVTHAIAASIRSVEAEAIETCTFFALACDSSMDRSANKQELVYTRTLGNGEIWTAFLGPRDLWDGAAASILAAYKQTMLHAGLRVEK